MQQKHNDNRPVKPAVSDILIKRIESGGCLVAASAVTTTPRVRVPPDPVSLALMLTFGVIACLTWATGREMSC